MLSLLRTALDGAGGALRADVSLPQIVALLLLAWGLSCLLLYLGTGPTSTLDTLNEREDPLP